METLIESTQERALEVAKKLRRIKAKELEIANKNIPDSLYHLFDNMEPYECRDFIHQLSCFFTDPEISSKLPDYLKRDGTLGKHLDSLFEYFDGLDDESTHTYFMVYELENCNMEMEAETIDNIERYQLG